MKVRITQLTKYGMAPWMTNAPVIGEIYNAVPCTWQVNPSPGDIDLKDERTYEYTIAACDYEIVEG